MTDKTSGDYPVGVDATYEREEWHKRKETPITPEAKPEWEYFCDSSYYDMWAVRKKGERRWGYCFHVPNQEEAKGLCNLLNGDK